MPLELKAANRPEIKRLEVKAPDTPGVYISKDHRSHPEASDRAFH